MTFHTNIIYLHKKHFIVERVEDRRENAWIWLHHSNDHIQQTKCKQHLKNSKQKKVKNKITVKMVKHNACNPLTC